MPHSRFPFFSKKWSSDLKGWEVMPSSPKIYLSCGKKSWWEVIILSSPKLISQIWILLHALPPPAKNQEGRKPIKFPKIAKNYTNSMKKITKILVQYFHHLFVHQIEVSGNPSSRWVVMINFDFILVSWLPWFILVSFWFHDCHDSFWFHVSLGER